MTEGTIIGYVVLTQAPNGQWQPDWDGVIHLDREAAQREAVEAAEQCGASNVRLANVIATFVAAAAPTGDKEEG